MEVKFPFFEYVEQTKETANDEKKTIVEKNEIIEKIFEKFKIFIENEKQAIELLNTHTQKLEDFNANLIAKNEKLKKIVVELDNENTQYKQNISAFKEVIHFCNLEISAASNENPSFLEKEINQKTFEEIDNEIVFLQKSINEAKVKNHSQHSKIKEILKKNESLSLKIAQAEKSLLKQNRAAEEIQTQIENTDFFKNNIWQLVNYGIWGAIGFSCFLNPQKKIEPSVFSQKNRPYGFTEETIKELIKRFGK